MTTKMTNVMLSIAAISVLSIGITTAFADTITAPYWDGIDIDRNTSFTEFHIDDNFFTKPAKVVGFVDSGYKYGEQGELTIEFIKDLHVPSNSQNNKLELTVTGTVSGAFFDFDPTSDGSIVFKPSMHKIDSDGNIGTVDSDCTLEKISSISYPIDKNHAPPVHVSGDLYCVNLDSNTDYAMGAVVVFKSPTIDGFTEGVVENIRLDAEWRE